MCIFKISRSSAACCLAAVRHPIWQFTEELSSIRGTQDMPFLGDLYRVGLKGLHGFKISRNNAAQGEKPAPICLSAIFGKVDKKSRNHIEAF